MVAEFDQSCGSQVSIRQAVGAALLIQVDEPVQVESSDLSIIAVHDDLPPRIEALHREA